MLSREALRFKLLSSLIFALAALLSFFLSGLLSKGSFRDALMVSIGLGILALIPTAIAAFIVTSGSRKVHQQCSPLDATFAGVGITGLAYVLSILTIMIVSAFQGNSGFTVSFSSAGDTIITQEVEVDGRSAILTVLSYADDFLLFLVFGIFLLIPACAIGALTGLAYYDIVRRYWKLEPSS